MDNINDKWIISKTIKKTISAELLKNQLKNVCHTKRLTFKDITRIVKNIDTSLFSEDKCCIWNGYITNLKNIKKGTYINFYFKKKKVALHRLLYANFVGNINDNEYLKFSCDNRGKCCNINHLVKYIKKSDDDNEISPNIDTNIVPTNNPTVKKNIDDSFFTINFD